MNYGASAYASLMMAITAVFLLLTAQFAITSSELRVSRMHERYSGLYEIGVSAAEARVRDINSTLLAAGDDILRNYMESSDWESQCEFRSGAFVLAGGAFYQAYKEIALGYIDTPPDDVITITHESGIEIGIKPTFVSLGKTFVITVANNSQRLYIKSMTGAVVVKGEIIWNPDPPVYTLIPKFSAEDETLSEKGFNDFIVTHDSDYVHVILSGVRQE